MRKPKKPLRTQRTSSPLGKDGAPSRMVGYLRLGRCFDLVPSIGSMRVMCSGSQNTTLSGRSSPDISKAIIT